MKDRITLLYPPACFPTSPYSSLPYLKSELEGNGIDTSCIDLNLEAFHYWFSDKFASALHTNNLELAINIISNDSKAFINPDKYKQANQIISTFFETLNYKLKNQALFFDRYEIHKPLTKGLLKQLIEDKHNPVTNFFHNNISSFNLTSKFFGISITYDSQLIPSLILSYYIKKLNNQNKVIIGGAAIPYLEKYFINNPWILEFVDLIALRDGVDPIINYLRSKERIQNCIYLDKNGNLILNKSEENIDFNNIRTPDYSCLPIDKYFSPSVTGIVLTSLGCYYGKCNFCIPSKGKNFQYQLRNKDLLIKDISKVSSDINSDLIFFGDDCINVKHLLSTLEQLKQNIYWQGEFRFEKGLNEKNIKNLKQNGCLQILLGLESANQRVSDKMNKGIEVNKTKEIIAHLKNEKILTNIQTIIGFPSETVEEAYQTALYLYENKHQINSCALSQFTLYQGSNVYKNPDQFGISIKKDDYVCEYETTKQGLSNKQSKDLSNAFFESISDYLPANRFFLDGPMGNHAMIYYKHNIKL